MSLKGNKCSGVFSTNTIISFQMKLKKLKPIRRGGSAWQEWIGRKMKITTKEKDEGIEISFNPEIDPKLKQYSEEAIKKNSEHMKYVTLKLWQAIKEKRMNVIRIMECMRTIRKLLYKRPKK